MRGRFSLAMLRAKARSALSAPTNRVFVCFTANTALRLVVHCQHGAPTRMPRPTLVFALLLSPATALIVPGLRNSREAPACSQHRRSIRRRNQTQAAERTCDVCAEIDFPLKRWGTAPALGGTVEMEFTWELLPDLLPGARGYGPPAV